MSVQLLLLQKSIYWSWVYCKFTKVKSWIHLLSRVLLLLPSSVWGEMSPAHPCPSSFPPTLPSLLAAHLSPSHCPSPKRPRVQPEKTKSKNHKETANFLWQGFWVSQEPARSCSLGWGCRIQLRKGAAEGILWVKTSIGKTSRVDYLLESANLHVQNNIGMLC